MPTKLEGKNRMNEDVQTFIEEEHPLLDEWSSYILSRRERHSQERRQIIGWEYDSNKRSWDAIISREWMVIEERLRGGVGVEPDMKHYFGERFFKHESELINEIMQMTSHLASTTVKLGQIQKELKIYTFEDFLMLSNQGIFRDRHFIIDPQSKWKRKIAKTVKDYGYEQKQSLILEGEKHYVISRQE